MNSQKHFNNNYDERAFYPPTEIKFSVYSKSIWKKFLEQVSVDDKVADFGCGGGTVLCCLEKNNFKNLYGVDFCNVIPEGFLKNTNFVESDVLKTPFENDYLDAVVSTMVIEHVDDIAFSKELYRVLKKDGVALITSVLKGKNAWYFYKNDKGERVIEPTHLREYQSEEEFEKIFQDNFEIIKIDSPRLMYPILDPFFRALLKIFKSKRLQDAPTRNRFLAKFRSFRIPIPGYYSVEILLRKK